MTRAEFPIKKATIFTTGFLYIFFRGSRGALIADLLPGSLSEGTLQPGDLIHAVDTAAIESLSDLRDELSRRESGESVYLYIESQMQFRYEIVELQ